MAFLPEGGGILVTERPGRLLLIRDSGRRIVGGTPDSAVVGQGGLLDIVLSPEFADDALVYISFSEEGTGGYGTSVARGRLVFPAGKDPRLENLEIIYRALPRTMSTYHFGSRLAFDEKGYLFITLGERGEMNRAQDPFDPYGSLLRIRPDGSIPTDNPFAKGGDKPGEGAPEIWSIGHRNAQGLTLNPYTGEIWLHEHGPKGGDEVNIAVKGANYGWPEITYGINYNGSIISDRQSGPGYEDPILQWTPSIAPSGMAFYNAEAFPEWRGNLFVGALAGQHLRRIDFRGREVLYQEVLLTGRIGRIRDVRTGPDGSIYLLSDEERGGLYRISPADRN